ncbi:MAG: leucyl/phenylalanyl-tRNA--protein transferase [Treponema sp.]|nr:leucyl/phenylalanyl-tRNA--protein transferase [Treponema sp.]
MSSKRGPDPDFPYLGVHQRFSFPDPGEARHQSIIAWGGNLSPGMLLSAYEQGLFPWYSDNDPVIWHSPDPRFIIFPEKLHTSSSMKRVFKKNAFFITMDRDFPGVIRSCAEVFRPGQGGTWITEDIIEAYTELHRLGWAHSAEAWAEGELAGGCYGVRIGEAFFAESMFYKKTNASKAALLSMARLLFDEGIRFIDCQVHSKHVETLGAQEISRKEYLELLKKTLDSQEKKSDT